MNRLLDVLRRFPLLALGAALAGCQGQPVTEPAAETPATSQHGQPAARVAGAGQAIVTDENGDEFGARFSISAVTTPGGATSGFVNIVFDAAFSEAWGAVPDVKKILVRGDVESLVQNGTITLAGTSLETEVLGGGGTLLFENEPFELVIYGPDHFAFQWCELPWFDFQVTHGSVSTPPGASGSVAPTADPLGPRASASVDLSTAGAACPRAAAAAG